MRQAVEGYPQQLTPSLKCSWRKNSDLLSLRPWFLAVPARFEINSPEMWRRRQKLDPDPLAPIPRFAHKDHPALQFFHGQRIFHHDHFAIIHFVGHVEQSAMRAHNYRFAHFAKFLPVVAAAMGLQPCLVKDSLAPAFAGKHCFAHAPILGAPVDSVNCPKGQVSLNVKAAKHSGREHYSANAAPVACAATIAGRRIAIAAHGASVAFRFDPSQRRNFASN